LSLTRRHDAPQPKQQRQPLATGTRAQIRTAPVGNRPPTSCRTRGHRSDRVSGSSVNHVADRDPKRPRWEPQRHHRARRLPDKRSHPSARAAMPAPARRRGSRCAIQETPYSPVAQPTPRPAPIGVSVRSESPAAQRKEERVLARSWLIAPPGSATQAGGATIAFLESDRRDLRGADERNGDAATARHRRRLLGAAA
jgi:hypothetical protein